MRRWIVVDGIDGSGKSTVARWIMEHYEARGERVLVQVHPSERLVGRISRRSLQNKGLLMYLISSGFYVLDVLISVSRLRKNDKDYDDVVFVRYLMGTAYLPKKYARQGYDFFAKVLPIPERLLLVDVSPETALERMAKRGDEEEMFENLQALEKVRAKTLMLSSGWRVLENNGDEFSSRKALKDILDAWD